MMHINSNLLWCYTIITFKVRAMFRIADDKAFCILVRISLALPLTSLRTFPLRYLDYPPSGYRCLVLISEVRTSGTSLRFSSPVSSPWTTLFQCDDLLGLAVGDASFNSIRSHFLTFGINWNIPVCLHISTFVQWLGDRWGVPG